MLQSLCDCLQQLSEQDGRTVYVLLLDLVAGKGLQYLCEMGDGGDDIVGDYLCEYHWPCSRWPWNLSAAVSFMWAPRNVIIRLASVLFVTMSIVRLDSKSIWTMLGQCRFILRGSILKILIRRRLAWFGGYLRRVTLFADMRVRLRRLNPNVLSTFYHCELPAIRPFITARPLLLSSSSNVIESPFAFITAPLRKFKISQCILPASEAR
ncbi:hypothetical protein ARMSODRAFT_111302 [Armillaria solidipes]|uniref:Uncharacterized protein n=1 Tax=Armillaria solidipes TaxID=1076256 RepID=A0A2H3BNC0_9AGAR|nr:hypothetical protein ARMSODRAFT_111302 [Armillaria solidipes]